MIMRSLPEHVAEKVQAKVSRQEFVAINTLVINFKKAKQCYILYYWKRKCQFVKIICQVYSMTGIHQILLIKYHLSNIFNESMNESIN